LELKLQKRGKLGSMYIDFTGCDR